MKCPKLFIIKGAGHFQWMGHQKCPSCFYHPVIIKIRSALLEGDYKNRRMAYFTGMKEVKANKKELERTMNWYKYWVNDFLPIKPIII